MLNADVLAQLEKKMGGERLVYPLTKIKIDQAGKFVVGEEMLDTIEFYTFKRFGEYIYFDPNTEKITKRTTIEEVATKCKEILTGLSIQELKDAGYDMRYVSHIVGFLITEEGIIPASLILKGASLKAYLDAVADKTYQKLKASKVLVLNLEQRKKGAVKYYVPVISFRDITENEAKVILEKVDEVIESFEKFRLAYNTRSMPTINANDLDETTSNEPVDF